MRNFLSKLIQLMLLLLFLVPFLWLSFRLGDNFLFYQGAGLTDGTAIVLGGGPSEIVQLINYEVDGETYVYERHNPGALWMYDSPRSFHFLYQRDDPTDVRLYYALTFWHIPLAAWLFSGSCLGLVTWALLRQHRYIGHEG